MQAPRKKWTTTSELCARYKKVPRTIERWVESGVLPKPTYIRKLKYWDEEEINALDAARKAGVQP